MPVVGSRAEVGTEVRRICVSFPYGWVPKRLFTYRDPFGALKGDWVLVPTPFGDAEAVVVRTRSFYIGRTKIVKAVMRDLTDKGRALVVELTREEEEE